MQQKNLIPTSTIFSILGLDPEVEKKTLEKERGTVLDPNAPKQGDIPGGAGPGSAPDTELGAKYEPKKMEKLAEAEDKTDFFDHRAELSKTKPVTISKGGEK